MRYEIREGSQSYHCCFEWTVVDTDKPVMIGGKQYVGSTGLQFEAICECWDKAEAEFICAAINR